MEIYVVISKREDSYGLSDIQAISFTDKSKAVSCASEIASKGSYSSNTDDFYIGAVTLSKIIKLNAESLRCNECELVLENGRFELYDIKPKRKNS